MHSTEDETETKCHNIKQIQDMWYVFKPIFLLENGMDISCLPLNRNELINNLPAQAIK